MMRFLKATWILFWATVLTLLLFLPVVISALLGKRGDLAFNFTQGYAWCLLKFTRVKLVVRGRENVQPGERYVILSNHASLLDPPSLVLALGVQYRWVIKKELRKVPLFGLALQTSRNVFIDRSRGADALASIKQGVAQLPGGTSVLLFPEGTRSWDGQMLPFKRGGFVLARDGGLPILPVTIRGSHDCLPKGHASFKSGTIEVIIHPPYQPGDKALETVMTEIREIIAADLPMANACCSSMAPSSIRKEFSR